MWSRLAAVVGVTPVGIPGLATAVEAADPSENRIGYRPSPRHGGPDRFPHRVAEEGERASVTVHPRFPG
jgi:hypothetical protein